MKCPEFFEKICKMPSIFNKEDIIINFKIMFSVAEILLLKMFRFEKVHKIESTSTHLHLFPFCGPIILKFLAERGVRT